MGQAGRERVLRHFRLEDQIDAFDRFYRQVLARDVQPVAEHTPKTEIPEHATAR